jgi:hypothetical protein
MRLLIATICVLGLAAIAFAGIRLWQFSRLWPEPSNEIIQLTPEKRALLQRLKAERKFQAHDYPPLGYTGAETPEDEARANAAVERVIDTVLDRDDGLIHAKALSTVIATSLRDLRYLATEDRERAQGYMIEIWYILGFKGATGHFAHGSAYPLPDGYGEPLPPGWIAPDKPRPIN